MKPKTIEQIAYFQPRPYPSPRPAPRCNASTVQPFDDGKHAMVLTHVCDLEKGHAEEYCRCRGCGIGFRAIGAR